MNLEQQYLDALEKDLLLEKNKEKIAKQQYIDAANKIYRCYKKYRQRKRIKAAKVIWRFYQKSKAKKEQLKYIQHQKTLIKIKPYFVKLKTCNKNYIIQLSDEQRKKLIPLVKLIKNFRAIKIARRKLLIYKLTDYQKIQLSVKEAKQKFSHYKTQYYEQQIEYSTRKIAILNEIAFIENIQQLNNRYFEIGLQNYQKELEQFIKSKSYESDYIEMKDQRGNIFWQNLKTLKKYDHNPIEKIIDLNFQKAEEEYLATYEEGSKRRIT